MKIFPAIDLKDGKVVRLTQGDYDRMEVYSDDPSKVARGFVAHGASHLHVVDLDGARDGVNTNFDAIRAISETGGLFVQVGGGLRDAERVKRYLDLGVNRVILGTAAVENFNFLRRMLAQYGDRIAVGVDARDGLVAVKGWRVTTQINALDFCDKLDIVGVDTIIYTDISRDGALSGTNLALYKKLVHHLSCNLIASGGITSMKELRSLEKMGLHGAILGKALYAGKLSLKEVLEVC